MQIHIWSNSHFLNILLCALVRILVVNMLMRMHQYEDPGKKLHFSEAQLIYIDVYISFQT